jgi:histidyl-tRNA synthetase
VSDRPKFQVPRGTRDLLPSDEPRWQWTRRTMEELAGDYGYRWIQTPGFEDTDLFRRTSGAGSDIVQKEMYTFTDLGGRSLTLRPEGTAPICRAYIEHGMHREAQPVKLFTIATMYRYAAPQKGRYREHTQWSVEAIGSSDPAVDAELLQLYHELLRRLGITQWELRLNSIGDATCRPAYLERLNAWLDANADALDEEARQKRETSPLRVFDVKSDRVQAALEDAPKIGESLCAECETHFAEVRRLLDVYGIPYAITPTLVRGLDYYTRTTFEYVGPEEGKASTICGGGRYDGLVEEIGGPPTPAIGFGAGLDRLMLALENENLGPGPAPLDVFFVIDGAPREKVLDAMTQLRRAGFSCDTDYAGRSVKGQMTQAGRTGARRVVVARADDAAIRRGGETEQVVGLEELVATLTAR